MLTCLLFVFFLQSQEKQNKLVKQSKEEEEIQRQQEKQMEIEQKAQQKYNNWLQKKNQEKLEVEKKEKVMWTFLKLFCFWQKLFFTLDAIIDEQRRTDSDGSFFLLDRRKPPRRRSGRESVARGQRRNLRNGWQKPMKKVEPVPNHLATQQVRSFQPFWNF